MKWHVFLILLFALFTVAGEGAGGFHPSSAELGFFVEEEGEKDFFPSPPKAFQSGPFKQEAFVAWLASEGGMKSSAACLHPLSPSERQSTLFSLQ